MVFKRNTNYKNSNRKYWPYQKKFGKKTYYFEGAQPNKTKANKTKERLRNEKLEMFTFQKQKNHILFI